MDYWIPASNMSNTISAIFRSIHPGGIFTTATKHSSILLEFATIFQKKNVKVSYIVLIPDEVKLCEFVLTPRCFRKENDKKTTLWGISKFLPNDPFSSLIDNTT
ncbi:hypothetical protein THRCLA_20895 [Thraustotheca clavata]|uniref:Uncharacterized protein n=1 Tax=Thraustotheca clavata TaxID=74557 RepID=A0A1W0A2A5_9STRA|nr:hypothetical protein THRCLA_20895 [Thraustotheca clavata]